MRHEILMHTPAHIPGLRDSCCTNASIFIIKFCLLLFNTCRKNIPNSWRKWSGMGLSVSYCACVFTQIDSKRWSFWSVYTLFIPLLWTPWSSPFDHVLDRAAAFLSQVLVSTRQSETRKREHKTHKAENARYSPSVSTYSSLLLILVPYQINYCPNLHSMPLSKHRHVASERAGRNLPKQAEVCLNFCCGTWVSGKRAFCASTQTCKSALPRYKGGKIWCVA